MQMHKLYLSWSFFPFTVYPGDIFKKLINKLSLEHFQVYSKIEQKVYRVSIYLLPTTHMTFPLTKACTKVVYLVQLKNLWHVIITQRPQFTLGFTFGVVYSVFEEVYNGVYRQLQYHIKQFFTLKILYVLPTPSLPLTPYSLATTFLLFPQFCLFQNTVCLESCGI